MIGKNITSTAVNLSEAGGFDNILELHEGSSITGNITTNAAGNGTLSVKGNTKIDGFIGAGGAINQLKFDSASTLELSKSTITTVNGIDFAEDGILRLTEEGGFVFDKALTVADSANGTGSIIIAATKAGFNYEFQKTIGDTAVANKALKLLEMKAGGNITFSESAAIKTVDIGSSDSSLTLNKDGGAFLIGDFSHSDAKGKIVIQEDTTLKAGTKLSSATNRLSSLSITGANRTLTVENDVDLYATGEISSDATANGTITFEGNSVVGANVGNSVVKLKAINVNGDGKTVDFLNKVYLTNDLIIAKGATATLRDQFIIDGEIKGAGVGEGTLRFANSEALTRATSKPVLTKIGAAAKLDTVEIAGADLTFLDADFNTNNLNFTSSGKTTITFEGSVINKLDNTKITTTSTSREHNIILAKGQDQAFIKTIGTDQNRFGNITLLGDDTITTTGGFYAGLVNSKDKEGTIMFINDGGVALNLGKEGLELKVVGIQGHTNLLEDVYSQGIKIALGKIATFKKSVSGAHVTNFAAAPKGLELTAGSSVNFEGTNTNVNIAIAGTAAGDGTANFYGSTNINNTIGAATRVGIVNFTNASTTNIATNISANQLNVDGTITATRNIELNGVTTFTNGSAVTLGTNAVTLKNGISRITGNATFNVTLNDKKELGSIIVDGATSTLDATNATTLTLNVDDSKVALPVADELYTYLVRKNGGNIISPAANKSRVTGGNNFVELSLNGTELTRKNIAASAVTNILGTTDKELLEDALQIVNKHNTGQAAAYTAELGRMDASRLKDSVKRVTEQNAVHANEMATRLMDSQTATINNRMGSFHPQPGIQVASTGVSGVAAGEGDHTMYGAWVSPFYSQTTQKARGSRAGYKADSYGATIGFDTQANADLTVGLAGTYAKTDAKHKNFKSGDKTEADTFMFSVYGIQQLTNNWFLQGHAAYATNKVKSSEKLTTATTTQIAKATYDVTSYNTELLAGYNYSLAEVIVTPLVGASYTRVNSSGYTETGATNQNRTVSMKATNKFEAVAGMRAQMTTEIEGINVTPEIHGFVRHDLIGKDAKVTSNISGMVNSMTPKSAKALKTTFNVGLGVNAVSGMYEYGAGYDLFAANKTIGHQGTLKVRVNF